MNEPPVRTFEGLIAWQKARVLTREIYRLTRSESFRADRSLSDQMRRASVSVMANIAEGYDRRSTADYARFLVIAKASAAELSSHLYVALDAEYISKECHQTLLEQSREVGRVIGGLLQSMRNSSLPGPAAEPRPSGLETRVSP